MKENAEDRNDWSMLAGVAVGAVIAILIGPPLIGGVAIGLCLGLLYAPKTGGETRRGIAEWSKKIAAKAKPAEIADVSKVKSDPAVPPSLPGSAAGAPGGAPEIPAGRR
jgi:gas vesicle protein